MSAPYSFLCCARGQVSAILFASYNPFLVVMVSYCIYNTFCLVGVQACGWPTIRQTPCARAHDLFQLLCVIRSAIDDSHMPMFSRMHPDGICVQVMDVYITELAPTLTAGGCAHRLVVILAGVSIPWVVISKRPDCFFAFPHFSQAYFFCAAFF